LIAFNDEDQLEPDLISWMTVVETSGVLAISFFVGLLALCFLAGLYGTDSRHDEPDRRPYLFWRKDSS
jgi:hypothetical protein